MANKPYFDTVVLTDPYSLAATILANCHVFFLKHQILILKSTIEFSHWIEDLIERPILIMKQIWQFGQSSPLLEI